MPGAPCDGGLKDPDESRLPRVDGKMVVAVLKAEAIARGLKVKSSMSKQDLLGLLREGSICMTRTSEYIYVEKLRQMIAAEERESSACEMKAARQNRLAQEAQEKEAKSEQQAKDEQEKKQKSKLLSAQSKALHTQVAKGVHPCPLAPSTQLVAPLELDNFLCGWKGLPIMANDFCNRRYMRAEHANCDVCSEVKECSWSCENCDFDICQTCFEIQSLPINQQEQRRKQLIEQEQQRYKQLNGRYSIERKRKLDDEREKKRETKELEQLIGKFRTKHQRVPAENGKLQGSGFTVWSSSGYPPDGWHSYAGSPEQRFDSSWSKADDANQRAKYLFYYQNKLGLSPQEMGNSEIEITEKFVGGDINIELSCHPEDSETWTVGVIPDNEFEHLDNAFRRRRSSSGGLYWY